MRANFPTTRRTMTLEASSRTSTATITYKVLLKSWWFLEAPLQDPQGNTIFPDLLAPPYHTSEVMLPELSA